MLKKIQRMLENKGWEAMLSGGDYTCDVKEGLTEKGHIDVEVLVCRDSYCAAMLDAIDIETALRKSDWNRVTEGDALTVVGLDVGHIVNCGRDKESRYLEMIPFSLEVEKAVA